MIIHPLPKLKSMKCFNTHQYICGENKKYKKPTCGLQHSSETFGKSLFVFHHLCIKIVPGQV